MELANGCMCCVAKSDIPRTVSLILDHSPQTEYILIEASGLSDSDPIKEVLLSERLASQVYLHTTICIIDSLHFLSTYHEHPLILSQAADSDVIILSKVEETSTSILDQTSSIIATNIPTTPRYEWVDSLPLDAILAHIHKPSDVGTSHHHVHEQFFEHWYRSSKAFDKKTIEKIFAALPSPIYRAKGTIRCTNEESYLLSYVAGKLTLEKTPPHEEKTQLLFLSESEFTKDFDTIF